MKAARTGDHLPWIFLMEFKQYTTANYFSNASRAFMCLSIYISLTVTLFSISLNEWSTLIYTHSFMGFETTKACEVVWSDALQTLVAFSPGDEPKLGLRWELRMPPFSEVQKRSRMPSASQAHEK